MPGHRLCPNYIQAPVRAPVEYAEVRVNADGTVDVPIGTHSSGQSQETVFPQLVSERLGVPYDSVRIVTGDSDVVPVGGGSHSDRSMRLGGIVMREASEEVVEKGKEQAARCSKRPSRTSTSRMAYTASREPTGRSRFSRPRPVPTAAC